jgi:plastocyanin
MDHQPTGVFAGTISALAEAVLDRPRTREHLGAGRSLSCMAPRAAPQYARRGFRQCDTTVEVRAMSRLAFPNTSLGLLAAGVLLAGLAGCGSSSTSSSSSSTTASTAPSASSTASTTASASASTSASSTAAATAPASGAAQVVKLEANPSGELNYNTTALTAHPGKVTIDFTNMAPLQHNVTVESGSNTGQILGHTPTFNGGTKSLTLNLKAGTYTFFCSVPGHRMAGMQGTLKVQ